MTKTMEQCVEDAKDERIRMLLNAIDSARIALGNDDKGMARVQANCILAAAQEEATKPLPMVYRRIDLALTAQVTQLEADVRVLAEAVVWCAGMILNERPDKITPEVRARVARLARVADLASECPFPHHD